MLAVKAAAEGVFMKNTFKVLGIIALVIIGFSFAACGDGGGGETAEKVVYTSVDGDGNKYELTITAKSDKAAYEPKAGDLFTLVITFANGTKKTSSGTVAAEDKTESGISLTLSVSGSSFTVSVSAVGGDEQAMTEIDGEIPITSSTDGNTASVPANDTPLSPQVENPAPPLSSATLAAHLATLPANTVATPHYIKLAVSAPAEFEVIKAALNGAPTKFVRLDLLGSTVTELPDSAFTTMTNPSPPPFTFEGCLTLTGIIIPNTIQSFSYSVFNGCKNLTSVNIPDGVPELLIGTFMDSGLKSITIPGSVKTIGESAFAHCANLNSVSIGSGVKTIGIYAFGDCTSLSSVTIPNSVTTIEQAAFNGSGLTSITIPNSVTSIGNWSFENSANLTSIIIPDSVTYLGEGAFGNCGKLANVTIGNGVTSLKDIFYGCGSLANLTIGNGITVIEEGAFANFANLSSVTIGNGVTTIEDWAFEKTALESITFGSGVTSIGRGAFQDITKLTSITIPDSVKNIGNWAFNRCYNITSVSLGGNYTSFGEWLFGDCEQIVSVTFRGPISSSVFYEESFFARLRDVFYEKDPENGTPGTYVRNASTDWGWALQ
jgi:hypothetical protein